MKHYRDNEFGFTLTELLITVALTGIIMSVVYAIYIANVKAVRVEEERVEMQQSQRIAIDFITRALRSAACDRTESDIPTIVDARSNFIYFTTDLNYDGDIADDGEHVAFCIYDAQEGEGRMLGYTSGSANTVGNVTPALSSPGPSAALAVVGHGHAAVTGSSGHKPFAPIEELEFFYTLVDGTSTLAPTTSQLSDIRSIQVTILSRTDSPDRAYYSNEKFNTPGGQEWGPYPNDGVRRRMMTTNVRLRNMGL